MSVPVLSEQITLTAPVVSVAIIFLISAFSFASFIIFSANETATMVGNPSGTAATNKIIQEINNSCTDENVTVPITICLTIETIKTSPAQTPPIIEIILPSFASFCSNGDLICSFSFNAPAILPISVLSPTTVTIIFPEPLETNVPEYTQLIRSANGTSLSSTIFAFFETESLSPVKADSLTLNSLVSINLPSATILSPLSRYIISPTTTSDWFITCNPPSLITLTVILS